MKSFSLFILMIAVAFIATMGCSGGESSNPVSPVNLSGSTAVQPDSQTHLWGYYDICIDVPSMTVTATLNRQAMFTANVVNFINGKAAGLSFKINGTPAGSDYIDIDIDVNITHPFPGLPQYNGYDVRGIFMGDGSGSLSYNSELKYPVLGTDQFMLADPTDGFGGPDGYSRWFNKTEFSTGGMPLFQYTQGKMASPGFAGTATLSPYKYFADSLGTTEDLWAYLGEHASQHGQFSSGATNGRNYYLRFPNTKSIKYGYAIVANWKSDKPEDHPSNAPEAIALSVVDSSNLYYTDPTNKGGDIKLDVTIWNWNSQLSAGVMDDYNIVVESSVLTAPTAFNGMTPTGGGEHFSTYQIDIPGDNIQSTVGNELWVIVEQNGKDYTNDFGVTNLADTDPLAAFFRYPITIGSAVPSLITVTSPNGGESYNPGEVQDITWTSSGVAGNVNIDYSIDDFTSNIHSIAADTPNTGTFPWTIPCYPSNLLKVRVSSVADPSVKDASDDIFSIESSGWATHYGGSTYEEGRGLAFDKDGNFFLSGTSLEPSGHNAAFTAKFDPCGNKLWDKKWGGTSGHCQAYALGVDSQGNVYITNIWDGTVDFNPDNPNTNKKNANGAWDASLVKYDGDGNFQWVKTWGGGYSDGGQAMAISENDDIYVAGWYNLTTNFDTNGGVDNHTSVGLFDCYVSKFDTDGNWKWAKTWGSTGDDRAGGCAAHGGNVYVTGNYAGPTNFDEGGSENHTPNGASDCFLNVFTDSGSFAWTKTWGGTGNDGGNALAADDNYVYISGAFSGSNVNFNPDGSDPHSMVGVQDAFAAKWSKDGTFAWAKTWGGWTWDSADGIAVDSQGNVCLTGWFWMSTNLDPDGSYPRTCPFIAPFVSKLDSTGDFKWGHVFTTQNSQNRGFGIKVNAEDDILCTGFYSGNTNFAPQDAPCTEPDDFFTDNGGSDAYLVKYLPDGCW